MRSKGAVFATILMAAASAANAAIVNFDVTGTVSGFNPGAFNFGLAGPSSEDLPFLARFSLSDPTFGAQSNRSGDIGYSLGFGLSSPLTATLIINSQSYTFGGYYGQLLWYNSIRLDPNTDPVDFIGLSVTSEQGSFVDNIGIDVRSALQQLVVNGDYLTPTSFVVQPGTLRSGGFRIWSADKQYSTAGILSVSAFNSYVASEAPDVSEPAGLGIVVVGTMYVITRRRRRNSRVAVSV